MVFPRTTFPGELATPVKDVSWLTLEDVVLGTDELFEISVVVNFGAVFSKCNSV